MVRMRSAVQARSTAPPRQNGLCSVLIFLCRKISHTNQSFLLFRKTRCACLASQTPYGAKGINRSAQLRHASLLVCRVFMQNTATLCRLLLLFRKKVRSARLQAPSLRLTVAAAFLRGMRLRRWESISSARAASK